jgi:acylphosphatase
MARMLGLSGYVRNMPDESVYIEAEGTEAALEEFTQWCHRGPERADVEYVEVKEGPFKDFKGFETRFG